MPISAELFRAILALYCATGVLMLASPLLAFVYFLLFRCTTAIAAYSEVTSIGGLPYFLPAMALFALQVLVAMAIHIRRIRINRVMWAFILFLMAVMLSSWAWTAIGVGWRVDYEDLFKIAFPVLAYFAVYLGIRDERDLRRVVGFVLLVSLVPIGTALLEFAFGVGYDYVHRVMREGIRPAGTLIDPNLFGIFLSLCLFTALPLVLLGRSRWALMYVAVLLFTIVIARNRGTWIAVAIAFLIAVPVFGHRLRLFRWFAVACVVGLLASPVMVARFDQLNDIDRWGQSEDTAAWRLQHSIELAGMALDSPVIGYGPGSSVIPGPRNINLPPHNDYVRVAYDYGLPALAVYVGFLLLQLSWTMAHRHSRLWPYQFGACAAQVYLIVISAAQNVLTDLISFSMIFFLLALSHRAAEIGAAAPVTARRVPAGAAVG